MESTAAATARPPVLRSRPLGALLAAEVLSTTGSQMTWLALPWFVLVTSGSKQMAFVIVAEAGGYALFGIPSGTLLERLGPQRTMRICDALRGPLMLLVPLLHWHGELTLPILAALAFALGAASTPYGAAQRIVVAEILDDDEASVERANALLQGATRITMLCGPALGGVLIAAVGAPTVLVVDAASYLVAFGLVTIFVPAARGLQKEESHDGQGLLAGVRYLLGDPLMRGWTAAIVVGDAFVLGALRGHSRARRRPRRSRPAPRRRVPRLVGRRRGDRQRLGLPEQADRRSLPGGTARAPAGGTALGDRHARAGWAVAGALALSGTANGLVNPTIHAFLTLRPRPPFGRKP